MQLASVISHLDSLWPQSSKEDWDRPGLMLGDPGSDIKRILLSVDVTSEVLDQAIAVGANLIISHHPMFLRGVHDLAEDGFRGANAAKAIRAGIAVYSAHTNADFKEQGVTNSLARAMGLGNLRPMDEISGHGAIGELVTPKPLIEFASSIAKAIPAVAAGVKIAGDPERLVSRVAVLGGAGDSYLNHVLHAGIDVYVTSDLRHHPAQDFIEQSKLNGGPALIDIAHWAAEWMWLDVAAGQLSKLLGDCEILVSDINTDPWTFAVMQ